MRTFRDLVAYIKQSDAKRIQIIVIPRCRIKIKWGNVGELQVYVNNSRLANVLKNELQNTSVEGVSIVKCSSTKRFEKIRSNEPGNGTKPTTAKRKKGER